MADSSDTGTIWLTQEARDKLQAELDHLSGPGRTEVAARIAAARDEGDLRENGGYHAAREEQGQQEARIHQLTDMLRRAQVGVAPADTNTIQPGVTVTVAYDGDTDDTETFLLGSREVLGLDDAVNGINVCSPQSALGTAIIGKGRGDVVSYETPNGKTLSVTILNVAAFRG